MTEDVLTRHPLVEDTETGETDKLKAERETTGQLTSWLQRQTTAFVHLSSCFVIKSIFHRQIKSELIACPFVTLRQTFWH